MSPTNFVSEPADKPCVLHVSGDFPDSVDELKTPVVRMLVDLASDRFRNKVVSINRRSPRLKSLGLALVNGLGIPRLQVDSRPFSYGQAVVYHAPSSGLFHAGMLRQLGNWLVDGPGATCIPDLLVGHKLTIEGIAVRQASLRLGIPYCICIQGDTDTKVLSARRDLTDELSKVFHGAATVFPFTPWALRQVEERLGPRLGSTVLLPCPTDLDVPFTPRCDGAGFVSVFHLKNHRRKNLQGMITAMRLLGEEASQIQLAIIGGGSDQEREQCARMAAGVDLIAFEGPLGRDALRQRLNRAVGFIMPSIRESFGLAFIEALFAGLPVIYPRNAAIDGYFAGTSFAIAVDARDPVAIAAAMKKLVSEEKRLKAELEAWQRSSSAERFRRVAIGASFSHGLARSIYTGKNLQ